MTQPLQLQTYGPGTVTVIIDPALSGTSTGAEFRHANNDPNSANGVLAFNPAAGTGYYPCGTWVSLAATAPGSYIFAGWSGSVSSSSEVINVPVDQDYVYEGAYFVPRTQDGCGDDCSPIVLDFGNATYQFSSAHDGVPFDIDGNGGLDRVAWPLDPRATAFLFRDHDGNGIPDDGRELFGNATRLRNGKLATNGFEALAELDSNGDGMITPADADWLDLRL